jgi:hypothetical protein
MSGYPGTFGRVPPVAPIMFIRRASFPLQRQAGTDEHRALIRPSRHRGIVAACFFILGLALFAIPFVLNFQGA